MAVLLKPFRFFDFPIAILNLTCISFFPNFRIFISSFMPIWSAEIKELEKLYESLKGQLSHLEKELEQLIRTNDANVIMLYSRRSLEVILTDLCECELKRSRGTEPLKGIIDKLHKEEKVPPHIITSMHGLNELSTYGTHPKDFDPEQVKPVLINLDIIIKWYLKYKNIETSIKTKLAEEIKQDIIVTKDERKKIPISNKRMVALLSGLTLLIVIVATVLFFTKDLDKSLAVLPFINDSPSDSDNYVINGLWAEVINNLQTIKDLRVLSRTSTDQYKGPDRPTIPEIAKKLGVNYIVEASGQMIENTFRFRVQLIKAKGKEALIWAKPYEHEIKEVGDYIRLQSQIAQAITAGVKATMTPDEKQLIEKVPTTDTAAYSFYLKGREEEKFTFYDLIISSNINAGIDPSSKQSVEKAEKMYKTALKYDPTFAPAYTGLAGIYWRKNYFKEYFSKNFMDSAIILANTALTFDDQLPDAYFIRGMYFNENSNLKEAYENFDKTLELNPNCWQAYFKKAEINEDALIAIKNYQEAASRYHGPGLSEIYNRISFNLSLTGFSASAKNYSLEAVKLESDSSKYYFWLWMYEFDYNNCYKFFEKKYSVDSTNLTALEFLPEYYSVTGQFKESLKFYKKLLERLKLEERKSINYLQRIGYVYWKNGVSDSADYYFNKQIENCNEAIRVGRSSYSSAYYDLAGIYAFKGDKIKAYENLNIYNQRSSRPSINLWIRRFIKTDPLFVSIRNEPEFQQIVKDMDAKYQAEHEKVKKWLKDQGIL